MDFDKLFEELSEGHYTITLYLIAEVTALVLGFLYVRKQLIGRLLIFYIAFDFSILITDLFLLSTPFFSLKSVMKFVNITNTIIATLELLIYLYFFSVVLINKKLKPLFVFFFLFYLFIAVSFIITGFRFISPRFSYIAGIVSTLELLTLIPFCIIFYRQLFANISVAPITSKPSFWIVTGIFLFSILSVPYFLISNFSVRTGNAFLVEFSVVLLYFPFAINFIFLSKAFLCKKPLTK